MAKLLVSVRSAREATAALRGAADWIDVKEPNQGALGAASPRVWSEVAGCLPESVPLSVACGELLDFEMQLARRIPDRVSLMKLGLSGRLNTDWEEQLGRVSRALPDHCQLVSVIYADYQRCACPDGESIVAAALRLKSPALLVDTFCKDGSTLLDHVKVDQLAAWFDLARRNGMLTVAAGSLNEACIGQLRDAEPDIIAVRGAVCSEGRDSAIRSTKVNSLRQSIDKLRSVRA